MVRSVMAEVEDRQNDYEVSIRRRCLVLRFGESSTPSGRHDSS